MSARGALSCSTGHYANTYLNTCLLCSTGCLTCCDENLCMTCDTGTALPTQDTCYRRPRDFVLRVPPTAIRAIKHSPALPVRLRPPCSRGSVSVAQWGVLSAAPAQYARPANRNITWFLMAVSLVLPAARGVPSPQAIPVLAAPTSTT